VSCPFPDVSSDFFWVNCSALSVEICSDEDASESCGRRGCAEAMSDMPIDVVEDWVGTILSTLATAYVNRCARCMDKWVLHLRL